MNNFKPNWLPKKEMIIGGEYYCKARNFKLGLWNGKEFEYIRTKFNSTFLDTELHWDDGPPFGTVKPILLIALNKKVLNTKLEE